MSAERPGSNEIRDAVALVAHEFVVGVKEGLLSPLNLAEAAQDRWGIKGVLGVLGVTVAICAEGVLLAWDVPKGVIGTIVLLGGAGGAYRLEQLMYDPQIPPSELPTS